MGLNTESPSTAIKSVEGARTELLGGLLYPVSMITEGTPAFSSSNATESLTLATSASDQARNYPVLVDATRNSINQQVTSEDVQHRGGGSIITRTATFRDQAHTRTTTTRRLSPTNPVSGNDRRAGTDIQVDADPPRKFVLSSVHNRLRAEGDEAHATLRS